MPLLPRLRVSKMRDADVEKPFEFCATRLNLYSLAGLSPLKVNESTEAGPGEGGGEGEGEG